MSIAVDNAGIVLQSATATSLTYAFTINTSSNTILFVGVYIGSATDLVLGITYNGVAMTRIDVSASQGNQRAYLYYLVNPAIGAHNVVVSISGGAQTIFSRAVSYTGAVQAGVPDASTTTAQTGVTTVSPSVTVVKGNCWLVGMFRNDVSNTATISPGVFRDGADGLDGITLVDSNGTVGTGSQAFTYAGYAAANVVGVMASFAPSSAGSMMDVF